MTQSLLRADTAEWLAPPSETVLRLIFKKNINLSLFKESLGLDSIEFSELLHDKIQITKKLAFSLSSILGGSEEFWKNRFDDFHEQKDLLNTQVLNDHKSILEKLSRNRNISIDGLLDHFKVSTFEKLISEYFEKPQIMYSKSQKFEPAPEKLASWVRNCEIIAENQIFNNQVPVFSRETLNNNLGSILALSKINSVENVIPKLKSALQSCGVILILSPSKSGLGVSGFTKSLLKKYRLIVITDRYKKNAAFWFTLLHELAHCLLHSIKQPIIHFSDDEFTLASDPTINSFYEEEANNFVEELLFSEDLCNDLKKNCRRYDQIIRLGVKYDISPSLLVAQIHRTELAPYSYFQKLYRKVEFDKIY